MGRRQERGGRAQRLSHCGFDVGDMEGRVDMPNGGRKPESNGYGADKASYGERTNKRGSQLTKSRLVGECLWWITTPVVILCSVVQRSVSCPLKVSCGCWP